MSNQSNTVNAWDMIDPWGMFRQMRDAYLETTAKAMVDVVNTEEYAQVTGAMLGASLEFAEPVRAWMDKVMPPVLAHYGMPSRKEVLSLASRMNNIELRLDDIEATLDEIRLTLRQCDQPQQRAA